MSSKLNQEELREHSLINLAHSNENQRDNVPPTLPVPHLRTSGRKPGSAHVRKTEENLDGPLDCSDNPMAASETNEQEENFFSLLHKNHHGSIDLGLDEKLTSMTGSYSEILDGGEQTEHEPDAAGTQTSVTTYINEMQEFHTKLEDKRKVLFGVKEVPRGSAAGGPPKPPDNTVARVPLSDRPVEEGVASLARDFMEKSSVSSQPFKRKECLLRNMNVTPNLPRSVLYPALPPFDPHIISDLEDQARSIATSMDTLIENLTGTLHSISALTVECVETYRDSVCKTCDAVDSNIKSMYQLMAKCEELSKSMKPVYKLHDQIKEIRRLLDLFEGVVFSGGS